MAALSRCAVSSLVSSCVSGVLRALQSSEAHSEQLQALMDGLHAAAEQQRLLQLMAGAQSTLRRFNAQHSLSAERVEELRDQWQEAMEEQSEVDRLLSEDLNAGGGGAGRRYWAEGGGGGGGVRSPAPAGGSGRAAVQPCRASVYLCLHLIHTEAGHRQHSSRTRPTYYCSAQASHGAGNAVGLSLTTQSRRAFIEMAAHMLSC